MASLKDRFLTGPGLQLDLQDGEYDGRKGPAAGYEDGENGFARVRAKRERGFLHAIVTSLALLFNCQLAIDDPAKA